VLSFRDIHDQVRIRAELEHSLQHDPMTGLAVRRVALDRIRRALDGLEGTGSTLAVLSIGVDGLTQVNDALTQPARSPAMRLWPVGCDPMASKWNRATSCPAPRAVV